MVFFGHLGPTTAVFKFYEKISKKETIDYRVVLVGSILPDLIDKPIGAFLFRNTFHNSRIFGHTLLFSLLLLLIGIGRIKKNKGNRVFTLGISTSIHLILDSMQLYKGILFWPFLGFKFPERPEGNWDAEILQKLLQDTSYSKTVKDGFIIIMYFFIKLIKYKMKKI
ncbi:metal-dependent hydrolase [Clostridium autoethanogenum]|uniref:Metal-dependent hydrolase n=1 Tax=Clostridium autoethanogenum TaxID=84023 RepID=A0A3M0SE62_9CLOT|nr:metal-dependent hydrolase [Clostridium autoethanogenum]RMC96793.1 metal-dependent hydrolase [Clostridium autoethanogenum]